LIVNTTVNTETAVTVKIIEGPNRACKSSSIKTDFQLFKTCTKVNYNIQYDKHGKSCELYFQGTVVMTSYYIGRFLDVYRIKILPCPVGFVFYELTQMCNCDPVLTIISSCNIDDQTILRPANSWIIASTNTQNVHTYQISSQCSFDYCLPHSSHLSLSTPDSQCQFKRKM